MTTKKEDATPQLETLSERLQHALEVRQMSQKGIEDAAKLSRGYATRILKGERVKLSPAILERIAAALPVSYEWLATGRGDLEPTSSPAVLQKPGLSASFALEAAIAYHLNKWSGPTVAAARAMSAEVEELDPPTWAELLDQIEAALSRVRLPKRRV